MAFLIHVYLLADLSLVFINLYNSQLFSFCLNLIHYMPFATGNLFKLLSLYKFFELLG